jgi:hypothetical protein
LESTLPSYAVLVFTPPIRVCPANDGLYALFGAFVSTGAMAVSVPGTLMPPDAWATRVPEIMVILKIKAEKILVMFVFIYQMN